MDPQLAFRALPRAARAPFAIACSVYSYKDARVSRLIWSLKYKKSLKAAAISGYALYRMLRFFSAAMPDRMRVLVVPMPITRARRRERGYNQCELLLDEIEKLDARAGADVAGGAGLIFARDLLVRVRHTSRQTLKDRRERLESIQDIFAVNEKAIERSGIGRPGIGGLDDHFVVVIDDVITTGSTIHDAINALRKAGFRSTYGLSVAH